MGFFDRIDWHRPDYTEVMEHRMAALERIRAHPEQVPMLLAYYRANPIQLIDDWGMTFDPRGPEIGLPSAIPFLLFPRQRDLAQWVLDMWRDRKPGLCEKSRDIGASWVITCLSATLCLLNPGLVIGFGSRKAEYVDKAGDPKSLFFKARFFLNSLPAEFLGGWDETIHTANRRIVFPGMRSIMTGEAGDGIGRGDRTSLYFVDESAHLERQELVDASLSATTNCRIDVSSVNGTANAFYDKRQRYPARQVFTFHWRSDPRKDDAWYASQRINLTEVVVAQEIDLDYTASVVGQLIPSKWVQAAVGAHTKLKIKPRGSHDAALDVADEGPDVNAIAGGVGILLDLCEEYSGKGGSIFQTTEWAINQCLDNEYTALTYDGDGLGAGVRGDADVINQRRRDSGGKTVRMSSFIGSGKVTDPESEMVKGRKNAEFFANRKAQGWWALRQRFELTFKVLTGEVTKYNPDDLISISPSIPALAKLCAELSQPVYKLNNAGKVVIDKSPGATKSPNLADAVMIRFAPGGVSMRLWESLGTP